MPHIKVKPFDTKAIAKLNPIFHGKQEEFDNELLLVSLDERVFAFDIIKKEQEYLIKPNKITKGSHIEAIKGFLNRLAKELELEITQANTNAKKEIHKNRDIYLKTIEEFYEFTTPFKKIKLEVGFGSGRHLLYRANEEKDTLFIGIEIHTPSINQVLKQIHLQNLDNIIIVNYDARLLLEMLPSNILDAIYVHFPVPWDKKPHRRVISTQFTTEAVRTLKKGAFLELRTDSQKYYNYALELFSSFSKVSFSVDKNRDIEVISKYEERWRRMQKDIYTIKFFALEESKAKDLVIDFSFNVQKNETKFPKESIVRDEFFVHFSRVYKSLVDTSVVAECSFGSFAMPEKKLLYRKEEFAQYYPDAPVKSLANFKAHQYINEVINGKCN